MTKNNANERCCKEMGDALEARFFKALCDPRRVELLVHLASRGRASTVSEAAECCPVDLSVVSRHLATLRDAGILQARKRGREVFYSVRFPDLVRTLRSMADAIKACCPTTGPTEGEAKAAPDASIDKPKPTGKVVAYDPEDIRRRVQEAYGKSARKVSPAKEDDPR